eukprot:271094-Prymnesium_polylepis.1
MRAVRYAPLDGTSCPPLLRLSSLEGNREPGSNRGDTRHRVRTTPPVEMRRANVSSRGGYPKTRFSRNSRHTNGNGMG